MTPLFSAFVPGDPLPFRWNAHGKTRYVPTPQRAWMGTIAWEVRARWRGRPPLDVPLTLDTHFFLRRPLRGKFDQPIGKPDCSNLRKLAEDAITDGGLWKDDSLVLDGYASKAYAGDGQWPGLEIVVWRHGDRPGANW
jgi:Holliday junction resolvase RusA-like endonuclease